MAATPEQQQLIIQKLSESPDWASAPPELKSRLVGIFTSGTDPRQMAQAMNQLHQQYPQYVTVDSVWKNPAFIAGLAALTIGVGSAVLPGILGAGAGGGGAASGLEAAQALEAGATEGITPALAGSLGADSMAGTGIGASSILGKVGGIASQMTGKVAPILGNMAKSGADANARRDQILPQMESAQLARDKFALDAPGTRLKQSVQGSILKSASPTKVNWGGPGSGLRGEVPTFTGGFSGALANIDPQTRALAEQVMHQDLQDQLAGKDDQTKYLDQFGHTSPMDKIVGGASTVASLYSAYKR